MKKRFLLLFVIPALLLTGLTFCRAKEKTETTKVYLEGNSIVYDGLITKKANDTLFKLYTKDINRLILNCNGGEINLGMDLGEWVFDHNLDVEIRGHAFSSAADYVFTVGKNKYLHKNSMIGWHGGANSDYGWFVTLLMKKYLKKARDREKLFFNKIQVNQIITNYGQHPESFKIPNDDSYVGWTYSLDALSKLGVKNIILMDGTWEPNNTLRSGKKIFTINEVVLDK